MSETAQLSETFRAESTPHLKALSLKILITHWTGEYISAKQLSSTPPNQFPSTVPAINMASCLARKQVAEAVQALVRNRENCGDDIFFPLLTIRCQKEIALAQQRRDNSPADKEYYTASHMAWEHILNIIQR